MPEPARILATAFFGRVLASMGDCATMARALSAARSACKPAGAQQYGAQHYDYVPPLTQCKFHGMFINYHSLFTNVYIFVHIFYGTILIPGNRKGENYI